MHLISLMYYLPQELIYKIRRLTYKSQSKNLLNDISHFYSSIEFVSKYYYKEFKNELNIEENADRHWLVNDIGRYLNNDIAISQGYKEKYKQTISKHYGFKNSIKTISTIIHNLTKLPVNTEINILWGIMTLNEREEMINIFIN